MLNKGSIYPFKIRIYDEELIDIYQKLQINRVVPLLDKNMGKKITWNIKPIRPDLFIGRDNRYNQSFIALKPNLNLSIRPVGKNGFEAIFSKIW